MAAVLLLLLLAPRGARKWSKVHKVGLRVRMLVVRIGGFSATAMIPAAVCGTGCA